MKVRIVEAETVKRKGKTAWVGKSVIPLAEQQFLEFKKGRRE